METTLVTRPKGEIVVYQPDNSLQMEVILLNETVWLSQGQMAELFQTTRVNITKHIGRIFKEGELEQEVVCKDLLHTTPHGAITGKTQTAIIKMYSLDVIISVGYRVKSPIGTKFRIWALGIIKNYVLRGYAVQQRIENLEHRVSQTEEKINFFVKTALPPKEGVFYEGQIFDAYVFVSDLVNFVRAFVRTATEDDGCY